MTNQNPTTNYDPFPSPLFTIDGKELEFSFASEQTMYRLRDLKAEYVEAMSGEDWETSAQPILKRWIETFVELIPKLPSEVSEYFNTQRGKEVNLLEIDLWINRVLFYINHGPINHGPKVVL